MNPLQAIRDEIARLETLKSALEKQLEMLRESVKALEPIYREQPYLSVLDAFPHGPTDAGLTHRIRQILAASYPGQATPLAIRDLLVNTGQVNPQGRSNFLAEIHNILKRLVIQEEAEEIAAGEGRAYRTKPARAPSSRSRLSAPPTTAERLAKAFVEAGKNGRLSAPPTTAERLAKAFVEANKNKK